jgi:uncharacterized MnhB-related membrane protein
MLRDWVMFEGLPGSARANPEGGYFYMVLLIVIVIGTLICAVQAIRVRRLLMSALWLAGASALVALLIYMLGAPEVAVIELSVGAGLVTVLFVFAINIAGEETLPIRRLVPRPLAWGFLAVCLLLMGWFILPRETLVNIAEDKDSFAQVVWNLRSLDMLLQVILIFTGVLGVVGLLAENTPTRAAHPEIKP